MDNEDFMRGYSMGYQAAVRELYQVIKASCEDLLESDCTDTTDFRTAMFIRNWRELEKFRKYMNKEDK